MFRMIVPGVLAALVIMPAAAQAQETITACYVPKSGSVYRIKTEGAPSACKTNHVEFSWTSGDGSGDNGGMVFTRHTGPSAVISPGLFAQLTAACDAGEVVVSGGWTTYPNLSVSVSASRPNTGIDQQPLQEWFVDLRNENAVSDIQAWAYAVCAKPAG